MSGEDELIYDRSLRGVAHHIGSYTITREMILNFAASTGETHPRYCDAGEVPSSEYNELIAPPTFCNIFVDGLRRPDIKLAFGDVNLLASQTIENLGPIRPGDRLEMCVVWETHAAGTLPALLGYGICWRRAAVAVVSTWPSASKATP